MMPPPEGRSRRGPQMSATPDSTLTDPKDHLIADLQRRLAECAAERDEALAQQAATAEVLQVINSSPGDLATVFDAILDKALGLCDAVFGNLWTYDGEFSHFAAVRGASPEFRAELMQAGPQKPEPGNALMRLTQGEPLVHIADITAEGPYRAAARRRFAQGTGARTALWVP